MRAALQKFKSGKCCRNKSRGNPSDAIVIWLLRCISASMMGILLVACPRPQLSTQYNIFASGKAIGMQSIYRWFVHDPAFAFKSIQIGYDAQVVGGSLPDGIAKAIVDAYLSDFDAKAKAKTRHTPESWKIKFLSPLVVVGGTKFKNLSFCLTSIPCWKIKWRKKIICPLLQRRFVFWLHQRSVSCCVLGSSYRTSHCWSWWAMMENAVEDGSTFCSMQFGCPSGALSADDL